MDVVSAASGYVSKMVLAGDTSLGSSSSKMKILLLDSETVRVYEGGKEVSPLTSKGHNYLDSYYAVCTFNPRGLSD